MALASLNQFAATVQRFSTVTDGCGENLRIGPLETVIQISRYYYINTVVKTLNQIKLSKY